MNIKKSSPNFVVYFAVLSYHVTITKSKSVTCLGIIETKEGYFTGN